MNNCRLEIPEIEKKKLHVLSCWTFQLTTHSNHKYFRYN